jgi:carboxymethylenebutenolidase
VCFETTARPPVPPRTGSFGGRERVVLRSDVEFAATFARTTRDHAPGVVILPDVRGLHPYYEALADAFADAGVHALAVDLYGRTAGAEHRDEGFDYAPHRAAATDANVRADVDAALGELRRRGASVQYVLGFCFGGRAAFMQGTGVGVAGVVGFYGWPARREAGGSSPLEEARAGRFRAPVLAIYGGADEKITADDRQAFAAALSAAQVLHETVVYDEAPHSFFDRSMDDHAQACDDAWRLTLRFFGVPAP